MVYTGLGNLFEVFPSHSAQDYYSYFELKLYFTPYNPLPFQGIIMYLLRVQFCAILQLTNKIIEQCWLQY